MGKLSVLVTAAAWLAAQTSGARLAVPGGELVYDVAGTGPAVVLLHGGFMDRSAWNRQVPALSKSFRVIRYDIRPFGESTGPKEPYSVPDDLLRLLDALKVGRAHIVGHSFGGGAALDFALTHPNRVASLVLVGAAPSGFVTPPEEAKYITAIFAAAKQGDEAVIKAWLQHPLWAASQSRPEVMKAIEASTRTNLDVFKMAAPPFVPLNPPAIKRLNEVKVPTLILVGDRDMQSIRDAATLMRTQIAGATLKIAPGADHALPLGWPDEFNAAVLEFLSRLPPPEAGKKDAVPGEAKPPAQVFVADSRRSLAR